jgi:hypothetical protein
MDLKTCCSTLNVMLHAKTTHVRNSFRDKSRSRGAVDEETRGLGLR